MGDLVAFPGTTLPERAAGEPEEPCPDMIAQLERALTIAKSGEMLGFVIVWEKPNRCTGSLSHTCCSTDLKQILAALVIEQHDIAAYISNNIAKDIEIEIPPEGA